MTKQRFTNIILLVVAITSLSFGGYTYYQYRALKNNNPAAQAQKETKDILEKVAEIYLIPTGEEPTIATVSDPNALKNQAFFAKAQKGDKVLIFSVAGQAVLYRPSINKIIQTAPINNNANTNTTTNAQSNTTAPATTGSTKDKGF